MVSRIFLAGLVFLTLGAVDAKANSYCSTTNCGTIQCAGGCYQHEENGVCTDNYCTNQVAVESLDLSHLTAAKASAKCSNAVSGSNSVSGCGNTVSGIGNVVSGYNNVVSGMNNYVNGSCLVVSGTGGYYTGNNCK